MILPLIAGRQSCWRRWRSNRCKRVGPRLKRGPFRPCGLNGFKRWTMAVPKFAWLLPSAVPQSLTPVKAAQWIRSGIIGYRSNQVVGDSTLGKSDSCAMHGLLFSGGMRWRTVRPSSNAA